MADLSFLNPTLEKSPYPLLFATISGAHLYGFASPDSDFDVRGVHILPLNEVVGLYSPKETVQQNYLLDDREIDFVSHDVRMFFELLLKKNGLVLEQIFSPFVLQTTPYHAELKTLAPQCITRHHAHHYRGLAESQWKLFLRDKPRRIKPLLYVYRALLAGIHLVQIGEIQPNLVKLNEVFPLPYISELIERKTSGTEKGTLTRRDFFFHEREVERLKRALEAARESSRLPEAPTARPALNDLLVRIRLTQN